MNAPGASELHSLEAKKRLGGITHVVLVGSGKGGVGKSFVACGLALSLARKGHRVGIFDVDLHGASVANYLGLKPPLRSTRDGLEPKTVGGVRAMSVALLTGRNPVPMRGNEKEDLITQFFALTSWGTLDYLVVDLPPSTGDELLSVFKLFAGKCSLILVSTPSKSALQVVSRLSRLARTEAIPVVGVALNMAFMMRNKRKEFPFGRQGRESVRRELGSELLVEFPLYPAVNSTRLLSVLRGHNLVSAAFDALAGTAAAT